MTRRQGRLPLLAIPITVGALVLSACGGTSGTSGDPANNAQVRQEGTSDINPQPADKVKDAAARLTQSLRGGS